MNSRPDPITELESRLRERLAGTLPGAEAQWRFAPRPPIKGWTPDQTPDTARRAAALLLIYPGAAGPSIALTLRRHDLPNHGGQISLPGGAIDPGESALDAALREAHEELGIRADEVRVVGALSSLWVVVSNFLLYPYVAVADHRPAFAPAEREVAAVIELPVAEICRPDRHGSHQQTRGPVTIDFPHIDVDSHRVWGATAMVLGEFVAVLA